MQKEAAPWLFMARENDCTSKVWYRDGKHGRSMERTTTTGSILFCFRRRMRHARPMISIPFAFRIALSKAFPKCSPIVSNPSFHLLSVTIRLVSCLARPSLTTMSMRLICSTAAIGKMLLLSCSN